MANNRGISEFKLPHVVHNDIRNGLQYGHLMVPEDYKLQFVRYKCDARFGLQWWKLLEQRSCSYPSLSSLNTNVTDMHGVLEASSYVLHLTVLFLSRFITFSGKKRITICNGFRFPAAAAAWLLKVHVCVRVNLVLREEGKDTPLQLSVHTSA